MTTTPHCILALILFATAVCALPCCASTKSATSGPDATTASTTDQPSAQRLAPRMDLHCTPSRADEEAQCLALGGSHHLRPQRFNNGPARGSQEALDREEAEYRSSVQRATLPCECLSDEMMSIPFQSPPH